MAIWVCSYGGSGTNWIMKMIGDERLQPRRWLRGPKPCPLGGSPVHHPTPFAPEPRPKPIDVALYVYRHPLAAFLSQRKRNIAQLNQRKLGIDEPYNAKRFALGMCHQMSAWKKGRPEFPVVLVRYECIPLVLRPLTAALDLPPHIFDSFKPGKPQTQGDCDLWPAIALWKRMPDFEVRLPRPVR